MKEEFGKTKITCGCLFGDKGLYVILVITRDVDDKYYLSGTKFNIYPEDVEAFRNKSLINSLYVTIGSGNSICRDTSEKPGGHIEHHLHLDCMSNTLFGKDITYEDNEGMVRNLAGYILVKVESYRNKCPREKHLTNVANKVKGKPEKKTEVPKGFHFAQQPHNPSSLPAPMGDVGYWMIECDKWRQKVIELENEKSKQENYISHLKGKISALKEQLEANRTSGNSFVNTPVINEAVAPKPSKPKKFTKPKKDSVVKDKSPVEPVSLSGNVTVESKAKESLPKKKKELKPYTEQELAKMMERAKLGKFIKQFPGRPRIPNDIIKLAKAVNDAKKSAAGNTVEDNLEDVSEIGDDSSSVGSGDLSEEEDHE